MIVALQFIRNTSAQAKRIILGTIVGCAMLAPFAYLSFQALDQSPAQAVLTATGRDMTLTDRTLLWADVINNAKKHPLLGVGYGAFWVGTIGYDLYPLPNWSAKTPWWRPEQGHNGYIDAYIDLGAIGLGLLLLIIVIGFADAYSSLQNDFDYGALRMGLLLGIIIDNLTETSLLKGTHAFWFLFLLLALRIPPAFRKVRPKPQTWAQASELDLEEMDATEMPEVGMHQADAHPGDRGSAAAVFVTYPALA